MGLNISLIHSRLNKGIFVFALLFLVFIPAKSQDSSKSMARYWMEILLNAIEVDGRGPTIHARNLFHLSAVMYDTWALFDKKAKPWLINQDRDGFECPCKLGPGFKNENRDSLINVTITYAAYRILLTRFDNFNGKVRTLDVIHEGFENTGLKKWNVSLDFQSGSAAALGNYIADCYLRYGFEDGSQELDDYENFYYQPIAPPLVLGSEKRFSTNNPNHWQPLHMLEYISKRGGDTAVAMSNLINGMIIQEFLSAEWGNVKPFSLNKEDYRIDQASSGEYMIYLDPGPPPWIQESYGFPEPGSYKWNFLLVLLWSSHLDPADSVYLDISPGAMGNPIGLPTEHSDYGKFYNLPEGGIIQSEGHSINPYTKKPYPPNRVLRGDYTRVLAEYWADAVNTAQPPGHWFRILNDLYSHKGYLRKWEGKGKELKPLEWDLKSYFILGGAVHDAAIASWSAKGFYDYVRPVTAIRYLSSKGQCSDMQLPNYHPHGLPIIPGKIELITDGDSLSGINGENIGKIKIYCWRGPDHITEFGTDQASVGWILGEKWWPYQRYSFPTPNFAGYVSGHSTFSTAAAEVLTQITGSPYFPGGIKEFTAKKNEFLEFEEGPSMDITLQWATYYDAAAETCLSRIWGGIHPPVDDAPARKMGFEIGRRAFKKGSAFF